MSQFLARLYLRWRIWRRDHDLMELIARTALERVAVCDETDSVVRCLWDHRSGQLVVLIYLSKFDHAAWSMSRHIEFYIGRQFKGLYGIDVHSVHIGVTRKRAFAENPRLKSATALLAVLRERRATGVDTRAVAGRNVARTLATLEREKNRPITAQTEQGVVDRSTEPARRAKSPARDWVKAALHEDEYLSVPGYEVHEVDFQEYLDTLPSAGDHLSDLSLPALLDPSLDPNFSVNDQQAPELPGFLRETDLIREEIAKKNLPS